MTRGRHVLQGHLMAACSFGMAAGTLNRVSYGRVADSRHFPEGFKEWQRVEDAL